MRSIISRICAALLLLLFVRKAEAYCSGGRVPLIPDVIGKSFTKIAGCSVGGTRAKFKLDVLKWAIIYKPAIWPDDSACYAQIAFPFQNRSKTPQIYYRRHAGPEYFKTIAPKAYQDWNSFGGNVWPCERVKVQVLKPFGKTRKLYIDLIQQTILGIQHMRDHECGRTPERPPVAYATLLHTLKLHRQYNALIDHLYSYSNQGEFCINAKKGTRPDISGCYQPTPSQNWCSNITVAW